MAPKHLVCFYLGIIWAGLCNGEDWALTLCFHSRWSWIVPWPITLWQTGDLYGRALGSYGNTTEPVLKIRTSTTHPNSSSVLSNLLIQHWFKPHPWGNAIMSCEYHVSSQICVCQLFGPLFFLGEFFLCACKIFSLFFKILHCFETHEKTRTQVVCQQVFHLQINNNFSFFPVSISTCLSFINYWVY